jgi:hypothetical protein
MFTVMYIRAREGEERDKEVLVNTKKAGKRKQNKERKGGKYWEEQNYREGKRGQLGVYEKKMTIDGQGEMKGME